ncbi:WD40 repeat domain-containing protein [Candidatus Kuenenbacteria bacterium]|nr:WD40 repeat domain-containing protein [Candidatus Kuenenbacteria bacterium]
MLNLFDLNTYKTLPWKKIGLVVGFLVVCLILGYLIYYLFFKPPAPVPTAPGDVEYGQLPGAEVGQPPGVGVIPAEEALLPEVKTPIVTKIPAVTTEQIDIIASGGVTQVTDLTYDAIDSVALSPDGDSLMTYNAESGKFYKISDSGTKELLSDRIYKNVQTVEWAPNKEQAILEFPDGTNVFYDFQADKQISLPKDWTEFSFNDSSSKIAFKDMNQNPDYRFVAISNPDGSGQKYLEPIGSKQDQFKVDWSPNEKMIAQFKKGKTGDTEQVFFVGQYGENFKAVTVNGYGLETNWTPDGSKLLYSAHNSFSDHKPLLHIVDASGDNVGYNHHSLNLNTWASKCTFADKDTAYCAVPKKLPYGANYVPELAESIADNIYKINLKTGTKSFIAEPQYGYTIEQIKVSEDGSNLFFTDNANHALHKIQLK